MNLTIKSKTRTSMGQIHTQDWVNLSQPGCQISWAVKKLQPTLFPYVTVLTYSLKEEFTKH